MLLKLLAVVSLVVAQEPIALKLSFSSDYTSYTIQIDNGTYLLSGSTFFRNNGQMAKIDKPNVRTYEGIDNFGNFNGVDLTWTDLNDNKTTWINTFKTYPSNEDLIVFTQTFPQGLISPNTDSKDNSLITSFPSFKCESSSSSIPEELGFVHFSGSMAAGNSQYGKWNSDSSSLKGGLDYSGVLSIFNNNMTKTLVISPLDNFMAHNTLHTSDKSEFQCGLLGNITYVPSGYFISYILVGRNSGINSGMRHWGRYMLKYYNKDYNNNNNRDYTLNYLGYSTDNGAFYYYDTESGENYENTIIDVYNYSNAVGIPYKYILLDSWWYYKGYNGGLANWTARLDIFPDGLIDIYKQTGWKIQAHSRYFSLDTVYATNAPMTPSPGYTGKQFAFEFGPQNGVPGNAEFWQYLFSTNNDWGLIVYEQDWLSTVTSEMPIFSKNCTFGRRWLLEMGNGALNNDLSIQYCMSYPRHVLTSLELNSVTQARASGDYHPGNDQWKLGFSGLFCGALTIGPSKDNFWTSQAPQYDPHYSTSSNISEPYPRLESVIATMSNGPVQIGDQIGYSDVDLILRSCNSDGLLLKGDISLSGIDNYYINKAFGSGGVSGELYNTYSSIDGWIYNYILGAEIENDYTFSVSDLSHNLELNPNNEFNEFLVYEANTTDKFIIFDDNNPITINKNNKWTFVYYTIIPIDSSISKGWYLQGEIDKWISVSNNRFSNILINDNSIIVDIIGANKEKVNIGFVNYSTLKQKIISCIISETLSVSIQCNGDSNEDLNCECNNY